MKQYIAFGQPVPAEVIEGLIEDGMNEKEITTEFLETLLEYEYRDND